MFELGGYLWQTCSLMDQKERNMTAILICRLSENLSLKPCWVTHLKSALHVYVIQVLQQKEGYIADKNCVFCQLQIIPQFNYIFLNSARLLPHVPLTY